MEYMLLIHSDETAAPVPGSAEFVPFMADWMAYALTRLAREDSGRVLAVLAVQFGDPDLADDAVQDAMAEAVASWPATGIPPNPAGWLTLVPAAKASTGCAAARWPAAA